MGKIYKTLSKKVDNKKIIALINEKRAVRPVGMSYRDFMNKVLKMSHTNLYNHEYVGFKVENKLKTIGITPDMYVIE
jgi:hypothetical protein